MKSYTFTLILIASLSVPVLASPPAFTPAASQDRGRSSQAPGQQKSQGPDKRSNDAQQTIKVDSSNDYQRIIRRVLEEYLGVPKQEADQAFDHRQLPSGLQKKLARGGDLPPGWHRKLAKGDVFPQDLYSKATRLPKHWGKNIDNRHDDEWLLLEDKIIRVVQGQGTILDIIDISQAILQ